MFSIKNRLFLSLLTVIFASLYLMGCAGQAGKLMDSAQASYRANDHEAALRNTVMALKHNPDYEKAQSFVTVYFKAAVQARQNRLKSLETSQAKFRWDDIVAQYKGLIEINSLVNSLPPLIHKKTKQRITFETPDYSVPLRQASEQAAEVHYQEGIRIADSGSDVETQKKAAKEFRAAKEFIPGYKDAETRYEQARSAGIKRMAILTFEDKTGKAGDYGALSETITDNIISNVLNDPAATEFLAIISRDQLEQIMAEQNLSFTGRFDAQTVAGIGAVAGVHELVIGQITQILPTPARPKQTSWNRQATIREKIGTETYVDNDGNTKTRPKYRKVEISARVMRTEIESSVSIIGSYKIINVKTAELKKADNFTTKHEFKAEWGRYTGDKRALDRSDLALTARPEEHAPTEEEMVIEAANQLASELAETLKAYAR